MRESTVVTCTYCEITNRTYTSEIDRSSEVCGTSNILCCDIQNPDLIIILVSTSLLCHSALYLVFHMFSSCFHSILPPIPICI